MTSRWSRAIQDSSSKFSCGWLSSFHGSTAVARVIILVRLPIIRLHSLHPRNAYAFHFVHLALRHVREFAVKCLIPTNNWTLFQAVPFSDCSIPLRSDQIRSFSSEPSAASGRSSISAYGATILGERPIAPEYWTANTAENRKHTTCVQNGFPQSAPWSSWAYICVISKRSLCSAFFGSSWYCCCLLSNHQPTAKVGHMRQCD